MNGFERTASSCRHGSTVWRWTLLLAITAAGWARAQQDFTVPPTLLIPNYDRVYPGLIESLEGGAVVARARNAPALFYNPAGIALSDRTVLNASAQGYQLTTLSGSGFEQTSGGAFETLPSFVGLVLGKEVIDWETVRIGFAVVHPVHSDLTVLASTTPAVGQRSSYAVHSTFDTLTPTFSVGWALGPSLRLGGSIEFPYTSLQSTGELSGEITDATTSRSTLRTLAVTGSALHLRGAFGVQWDALSWLKLGALVRTTGLKIKTSGSTQYEALTVTGSGTRQVFFQDPEMDFQYKLPLEAILGVALEFGPFGIEIDLKWHDGTDTYPLYASTKTLRIVDTTTGTPVISEAAYPGVSYRARQLWNGSAGAHFALSENFVISAGAYLDYSPVDPAVGKAFRKLDVVGFRAGVAFRIDKLTAAIGGGWEHGTGNDNLFPPAGLPIPEQPSELTLNTFTLLFSVSFRF
jgi:hypothetical protein